MKRLIALLLALVMVFALVACGGDTTTETPTDTGSDTSTDTGSDAAADTGDDAAADTGDDAAADTGDAAPSTEGIPASVTLSDSTVLQGKRIGCTIVYKGDEWCAAVANALERLGEYYGCEITVEDGDISDETQTKQIENMLANNCDMLFIDPATPGGTDPVLMQAVDAGIPIIIYDGYWDNGEEYAESTITWDQYETGVIVGEYFVDYITENMDGQARVVELNNAASPHCLERFDGLHAVIDEANANGCNIEVLSRHDSQGNRELAYNAISAIVEPYDFVISDVDNGAQGAVSALQANGNTDVKVLSMGAYGEEPFSLLYNNDPNYLACLNVDAWILAEYIYQAAINYYEGVENETTTNIDLYMVDNSNVTDFWTFE